MKLKVYRNTEREITHVSVFADEEEVTPPAIGEVETVERASLLGFMTLQALDYRRAVVEMDSLADDIKYTVASIHTEAEYIMGKGGVTE